MLNTGKCFLSCFFLLLIVSSGLAHEDNISKNHSRKIIIQLKWKHQFQFAGYYMAKEKGFYKEADLDVDVRAGYPGLNIVDEVVSGRADVGVYEASILVEHFKGLPVVLLGVVAQHSPLVVVALKKSKISSLKDIVAKKVMMRLEEDSEIVGALLLADVDLSQIDFIDHSWDPNDLLSGKVDVASAYITDNLNTRFFGVEIDILDPRDYGVDFYNDCLFTSESAIENKKEAIDAFLAASWKGWEYAFKHPEETIDVIKDKYKSALSKEDLLYECQQMRKIVLPDLVDIGSFNPRRWAHIRDTYAKLGILPRDYDFKDFLYDPEEKVNRYIVYSMLVALFLCGLFALILLLFNRRLQNAVAVKTAKLQNRERWLQEAQNIARMGHWMYDSTTEDIYVSDAFFELWGVERMPPEKMVGELLPMVHPDDRERALEISLIKSDGSYNENVVCDEYREIRYFVAGQKRYGGGRVVRSENPDGSYAVLGTMQDITERVNAIKSHAASENNLRITLDSIVDGVIATDDKGEITRINPAALKMTGWNHAAAIGAPLSDVFKVFDLDTEKRLPDVADVVLRTGIASGISNRVYLEGRDGSRLLISDNAAPIRNNGEQIVGMVLVFRDVTENAELEESLRQAQKLEAIGKLAGGVAHDFNNLLGGIMGFAELLLIRSKGNEEFEKYLTNIIETAEKAAGLTLQLLAFARKGKYTSEPTDINHCIKGAVDILRHSLDRNIEIVEEFTAEEAVCMADPLQIQNAIINLGINSRDAMPTGGELSFSTSNISLGERYCSESTFNLTPGEYLLLKVKDNGLGIPAGVIDNIFDPFFTTKDVGAGTGLGLSAVFGTVVSMDGAVEVKSVEGEGAEFDIFLPLCSEGAVENAKEISIEPMEDRRSGRILVVDDEPIIRAMAKSLLEEAGYEVLLAENGKEGLKVYLERSSEIDLILVDVVMPIMGAQEVIRGMLEINPEARIIVSSGFSKNERISSLLSMGAKSFVKKPFRQRALLDAIESAMK